MFYVGRRWFGILTDMNSHHAIVCIASSLESADIPQAYKVQSSDVTHIITDRFAIADARALSTNALQKPIEQDTRVFVLVVKALPIESQNALLKLFEDPPEYAQFYLVIPQEGMLIPTLASRVSIIDSNQGTKLETNDIFETFHKASYADRLSSIADAAKKKDVQFFEEIVVGAEVFASKDSQKNAQLLSSILFIRGYLKTPGASAKMLCEELALSLPKG
ncbi:MAG: hypothetical protein ACI9H6_000734 [Patiriisocius sp.]|jgi:hypothetical protein